MVNNNFLQTVDKYGILSNDSNKITQFYFDKIVANKTIKLNAEGYLKYGWIFVSVVDGVNFELYYNDICLFKCSSSNSAIIPCVFEKKGTIVIKGQSGETKLALYGKSSYDKHLMYMLPFSKYLVSDRGNLCLLEYESNSDIKSGNLTQSMSIENCLDVREIRKSSTYRLYWLVNKSTGLYLYIKVNDNTQEILVGDSVSDGRILSHYGSIYVVYIRGDSVYYKVANMETNTLGNEISLDLNYKYVPKSFSKIQLDNISSNAYMGVNFDDGAMHVYKLNQTNFERILSKRADFSKIIINNRDIELITLIDYEICICKYVCNTSGDLELQGVPLTVYNATDVLKLDNKYLFYSNGICTEVSYDTD